MHTRPPYRYFRANFYKFEVQLIWFLNLFFGLVLFGGDQKRCVLTGNLAPFFTKVIDHSTQHLTRKSWHLSVRGPVCSTWLTPTDTVIKFERCSWIQNISCHSWMQINTFDEHPEDWSHVSVHHEYKNYFAEILMILLPKPNGSLWIWSIYVRLVIHYAYGVPYD